MHFVILCIDKPGQIELRKATRPEHINYLNKYESQIVAVGPTLNGDKPNGSLIIIELDDLEAAQSFAEGDPYSKAGIFESVSIKSWKKVFPKD
tara:strand:- start:4 stop:282 length:279 start_codon:yes stop_codon:yes gene_type:complete